MTMAAWKAEFGAKQPYKMSFTAGGLFLTESVAVAGMHRSGEDWKDTLERALKEDPDRTSGSWPDLMLIDGGKGQLSAVTEVMDDLGITDIAVVAISKGPDRNAGREQFHIRGRQSFTLPPHSSAMHFLQRLRDESHRYAIGTHRAKRQKSELTSPLDAVPGIGPKRKKALLAHFGSARAVSAAGLKDLKAVEGVSEKFAQQIYDWFYGGKS